MSTGKTDRWNPNIVVFACNWCSYAGADTAGVSRIQHQPHFRMIRVMCSGRIQPGFVFRSFEKGADGVLVSGCHYADCHYIDANRQTVKRVNRLWDKLEKAGVRPERLQLEWISAAEGTRFAEVMSDFARQLKELGPLGVGEEIEPPDLKRKLEALSRIVPFVKLVEREKLRVPVKSEEAYNEFFASAEVDLGFTTIHAPFIGRIGRSAVSPGDLVGPTSGTLPPLKSGMYWISNKITGGPSTSSRLAAVQLK